MANEKLANALRNAADTIEKRDDKDPEILKILELIRVAAEHQITTPDPTTINTLDTDRVIRNALRLSANNTARMVTAALKHAGYITTTPPTPDEQQLATDGRIILGQRIDETK